MPWSVKDVDGFKKGLSGKQKHKWVSIANGVLKSCKAKGTDESKCAASAIKIANSNFKEFNPVISGEDADTIMKTMKIKSPKKYQFSKTTPPDPLDGHTHQAAFDENGNGGTSAAGDPEHSHTVWNFRVDPYFWQDSMNGESYISVHPGSLAFQKTDDGMTDDQRKKMKDCMDSGGSKKDCMDKIMKKMADSVEDEKDPGDSVNSEEPGKLVDMLVATGNLDGITEEQKIELIDCLEADGDLTDCIAQVRGGNGDEEESTTTIEEMEIFRIGTHNGDEYTEKDLQDIADNFKKLKGQLRPKLKITHHGDGKEQVSLAGLASYGDVIDVFIKESDGEKRLYAKIINVPNEVAIWISEGRFSERSIEIYPEFKLGTQKDGPTYKNVLKAIALLGNEMPAVHGMAPVKLSSLFENQKTICLSDRCVCEDVAESYLNILAFETKIKSKILN